MNLGRRFFLLNTATILITILATSLAAMVFIAVYTKISGRDADINDLIRVAEVKSGFEEIKKKVDTTKFEQYLGDNYRSDLAASVKALGAEALLVRDREELFSTRKFDRMDIEKCLVYSGEDSGNNIIELEGRTYLVDRVDFKAGGGTEASLLLLAPVKLRMNFYQALAVFTIVVFVLTFLGLNLWVSIAFSKGVTAPISRLKAAAAKISAGELSNEIAEEGDGEIKELCRTLEQLRLKLKESVYLQARYDDNRKFLISSISHDLKTPVTSIKGYIEGILDGVAKTPEKMQAYLETVRDKALLVNSMIDDLLLYSRLDMNQIPFDFERTDLKDYLEYCVADSKPEFEKSKLDLLLRCEAEGRIYALIDRERFKRILQNILDNARKYMERPDGRVEVILRETRTSALIEIRDNGKGISQEALPHIFERFYREDASRKSTDGSGLGLAIAKQIVEGHDGKIWAVSNAGEGTGIILSLKKY